MKTVKLKREAFTDLLVSDYFHNFARTDAQYANRITEAINDLFLSRSVTFTLRYDDHYQGFYFVALSPECSVWIAEKYAVKEPTIKNLPSDTEAACI